LKTEWAEDQKITKNSEGITIQFTSTQYHEVLNRRKKPEKISVPGLQSSKEKPIDNCKELVLNKSF